VIAPALLAMREASRCICEMVKVVNVVGGVFVVKVVVVVEEILVYLIKVDALFF